MRTHCRSAPASLRVFVRVGSLALWRVTAFKRPGPTHHHLSHEVYISPLWLSSAQGCTERMLFSFRSVCVLLVLAGCIAHVQPQKPGAHMREWCCRELIDGRTVLRRSNACN